MTPTDLAALERLLSETRPDRLSVVDWFMERVTNSLRIAETKSGGDCAEWLKDAAYLKVAVVALTAMPDLLSGARRVAELEAQVAALKEQQVWRPIRPYDGALKWERR